MKKYGKILTHAQEAKYNEYQNKITQLQKEYTSLFRKYCDMEGKYGKWAYSPEDTGIGLRGYHYEYPTKEVRIQEEEEREKYYREVCLPVREEQDKITDEYLYVFLPNLCKELTGMTEKEWEIHEVRKKLIKDIKNAEKELKKCQKRLKDYEEENHEILSKTY